LLPFLNYLCLWDKAAADRVDHFVAISLAVRQRIANSYPYPRARLLPGTHDSRTPQYPS